MAELMDGRTHELLNLWMAELMDGITHGWKNGRKTRDSMIG